ncbi:MAG: DUF6531 domain-containing protein, partial [Verrucomicrobiota bacterium]
MLLVNTHNTLVIGIDVHITTTPPFIPVHPFIGLVLDPMDYIPFLGGTVYINGQLRGVSDTSGILTTFRHIPMPSSPWAMAPIIAHESMNFFGSQNVYAEGIRLSPKGFQVMTCNDVGVSLSPPSMFAPTSTTISIPTGKPVMVAGPYIPDWEGILAGMVNSLGFGALKKIGGAVMKRLNKRLKKALGPKNKLSKALCYMGFEPINLVTGAVVYEGVDFELPGPIPLAWERNWYSDSNYDGWMGYGIHCNFDRAVELYPEEAAIGLRMADGRILAFPPLKHGESHYLRPEKTTLTRNQDGTYTAYAQDEALFYHFEDHTGIYAEHERYYLTRITDARGFAIRLHRRSHALTGITDSAGRELEVETDAHFRITEVKLKTSVQDETLVRYAYNEAGDLVAITDALGQTTAIDYADHLMVKKTDRNGQAFYWKYEGQDTNARCIETWGDGGWQHGKIAYHTEEGYNLVTDANGNTTRYKYTPEGLVTQITNAEGGHRFLRYTPHMELYREIDEEGCITGYTYDEKGNRTGMVHPDGAEEKFAYNKEGRLEMYIDGEGNKRMYIYCEDRPHLLDTIIEPDNSMVLFGYNEDQLVKEVKSEGRQTTLQYGRHYNLEAIADQEGHRTEWEYDYQGQVLNVHANGKFLQSFHYDNLGRAVDVTTSGEGNTRFEYNAYDEVTRVKTRTNTVDFAYTPLGNLRSRTENGVKVHFAYDKMEQLNAITNEHGQTYHFSRNKNGEITKETGFDATSRLYERDLAGRVIRTKQPDGTEIEYEYDRQGRLTRAEYADEHWETYSYNKNGLLVKAGNPHSAVALERDKRGRVVKERQYSGLYNDEGHTIESRYDKNGQRIETTSSLGAQIHHAYDSRGQRTETRAFQQPAEAGKNTAHYTANLSYNAFGQEVERVLNGQITSRMAYDYDGRLENHRVSNAGREYRNTNYVWNPNHQLRELADAVTGRWGRFVYDAFGALASAMYEDGSYDYKLPDEVGNLYQTEEKKDRQYGKGGQLLRDEYWHYLYDANGNLTKKTKYKPIPEAKLKAAEQRKEEMKHEQRHFFDWLLRYKEPDPVEALREEVPQAEAPWEYGQWQYEWQGNGMLKSVRKPDGTHVRFEYDALGRRTAKVLNGQIQRFVYDGNVLLHQWEYEEKDRPKTVTDEVGMLKIDKEEPVENLVTWVFEEGTFVPEAKITEEGTY